MGTPVGNYWLAVVIGGGGGEQSPRNVVGLLGLGSKMVFMPEDSVVATGGRFDKIMFFVLTILARLCRGSDGQL